MTLKNLIPILITGIIILIASGCMEPQQETEPMITPTPAPVSTTSVTPAPSVTPVPTLKIMPSNTLYVKAFMLRPVSWGPGKYEVKSVKVEIINQINDQVSIKALIMSDEEILEETSFTVGGGGGRYQFSNQKQHFINSTNVTLRLLVQDFQPVDYEVKETSNLD